MSEVFRCGHKKCGNVKVLKRNGVPSDTCLQCFRAGQNRYRKKKYRADAAAAGRPKVRAWGCGDKVIIAMLRDGLALAEAAQTLAEARAHAAAALFAVTEIEARRTGEAA